MAHWGPPPWSAPPYPQPHPHVYVPGPQYANWWTRPEAYGGRPPPGTTLSPSQRKYQPISLISPRSIQTIPQPQPNPRSRHNPPPLRHQEKTTHGDPRIDILLQPRFARPRHARHEHASNLEIFPLDDRYRLPRQHHVRSGMGRAVLCAAAAHCRIGVGIYH